MTTPPPELEPSDGPEAVLEGNLATVTDDEYFAALAAMPPLRDADTNVLVNLVEGVRDERDRS